MKRQLLAAVGILAWASAARATSVQLNLVTSDPTRTSGTWTVTATLSDNQTLGIVAFSIDVIGSSIDPSGVTVRQAATPSQTLIVSNPPYSIFRSNGLLSPPSLTQINASQPAIEAAEAHDPSLLRFGDGLLTNATSTVYGTVPAGGPLALASGQWTTAGTGGTIQAVLTPGAYFNLFPLNYAVDDGTGQFNPPPAGTVQNAPFASAVFASPLVFVGGAVPVPEPASVVLFLLGSAGSLAVTKRYSSGIACSRASSQLDEVSSSRW